MDIPRWSNCTAGQMDGKADWWTTSGKIGLSPLTRVKRPHTVTTTYIKTNIHHIHTSIVSRHLATRGNNKIMCTPPPHISSSEEILRRLTRSSLAQLGTNKSPFFKSYLHKVVAKSHHHYAPFVTLTYTISLQLHPHCHPWFCGHPD